jgi:hypothetical protein
MYHLLYQSLTLHLYLWVSYDSQPKRVISLNSINQLIFLMVKYGVLFEVQAKFLSITYVGFGFKGLKNL